MKNCTKLHCEFHKWIKIITFLCALKKITILFQLNGITDFVISSFKRAESTSTYCTHEMCQWHKQPVPFDSLCRAYLIAVQCQFLLTLAEKYFNRPSTHIPGKNLLCRFLCPKALMPSWKPTVWTSRYRNLLPLLKSSTPISTYSFPIFSKPEK